MMRWLVEKKRFRHQNGGREGRGYEENQQGKQKVCYLHGYYSLQIQTVIQDEVKQNLADYGPHDANSTITTHLILLSTIKPCNKTL